MAIAEIAPNQVKDVGTLLRDWRNRRRLSQLELACAAEISTRHLSFLETGRSLPSREMILRLAEHLEVPLRDRNSLLVAAGYAAMFQENSLTDPGLQCVRRVLDLILNSHQPFPALAIDRHWTLVAANQTAQHFFDGIDSSLLSPQVNVLKVSLHPLGLAKRIVNFAQWRTHLLARLRRQIEVSSDAILCALLNELTSYPIPTQSKTGQFENVDFAGVAVPLQLMSSRGVLSFFSMTTIFGTPVDITVSELALESFFPADEFTLNFLNQIPKQSTQ